MSNAFEEARNQGYSAAEKAADAQAFIEVHGCLDCHLNGRPGCLGDSCDDSYKGGRT